MSLPRSPLTIRMHADDNVAIVANDGGLPAGTVLPEGVPGGGLTLLEKVPQGHKVALETIPQDAVVRRYGVPIGYALKDLPAGSWVHERVLEMPAARALEGLPMATVKPPAADPLDGYTFEGYRNADGSAGTRNLLAITTTVQCVAGVVAQAVARIKAELLPDYPNVDDVIGLEHSYGCGVAIDAPDAVIAIRTLRHISLNPNFGGEVMVVSLGCEKLQPDRLLPPGSFPSVDGRDASLDDIVASARPHLARLNARRRGPALARRPGPVRSCRSGTVPHPRRSRSRGTSARAGCVAIRLAPRGG